MEEKDNSKQLLIKIKIPKLEEVVEEHDDDLEEGEIREEDEIKSTDLKTSLMSNPNPNNNDRIRVCPECKKEFSSGKALGGHMRIHSQQKQSNPCKKKLKRVQTVPFKKTQNNKFMEKSEQQQQQDYLSKCTDEYGRAFCTLCGKIFPSIKSLCGHMRCHPERYWRGISPPDHDQSSVVVLNNDRSKISSSSLLYSTDDLHLISNGDGYVDVDDDDDFVFDLPNWSLRAKRSRRGERSSEVGISSDEEEEEVQLLDAVGNLMLLANGYQSLNESGLTHNQQRVNEFEATNSNSSANKDDSGLKKRIFDEKMKGKAPIQMFEDDKFMNLSDDKLLANNELLLPKNLSSSDISTTPKKARRKKKMKLMMDLESGLDGSHTTPPRPASKAHQKPVVVDATTPDKYKCSTCNKCFPTHQALGGHRSSHNKIKITILNAVVDKEDRDEDNGSNEGNVKLDEIAKESVVASSGSTSSTHQCTICTKVFPTGQALGGHLRCHWKGPVVADQAGPPSSQVTYSSGEASQTKWVLEFDLNEEPPMQDEGGDNDNVYAVSSSYNPNVG